MKYETAVDIGRGATARVYRAWDPETERPVALKIFEEIDEDAAARLEREIEAQASLKHPAICELYEVGTTSGGKPYLAMRYVDGEPFDEVASRLPLEQRVRLVREVADAVACAHRAGIVHRDLKPGNLLVEEQPDGSLQPFVLDFGIARLENRETQLTETGRLLGTPGYVSPEQVLGEAQIDARSDVFSLGVVLYQALTGELPFAAESSVGALIRALEIDPPLAHAREPGVPRELSHIAHKAMEKDPRRRYPDAGALRRDLDRYLESEAISARSVGPFGRWLRRVERRPVPWIAGFLLLLVALGALGWSVRSRLVAQQEARIAERLSRRAAEIEARLRYLELLPRQTLSETREQLGASLRQLQIEVGRAPGLARAAGEFAVGRSFLKLGETEDALCHLRRAEELGFEDPALAVSLGTALLEQARGELRRAAFERDPEVQAAEREAILQRLEVEALPQLQRGSSSVAIDGSRLLAQASAAFLLGDQNEAERLAVSVGTSSPWLYEADLVRADIHRDVAARHRLSDRHEEASAALDRELQILAEAEVRAPSAHRIRLRQCEAHLFAAIVGPIDGTSVADYWTERTASAQASCEAALEIAPTSGEAQRLLTEILWRRALVLARWRGADAGLEDAQRAVALARGMTDAAEVSTVEAAEDQLNLGNALYTRARLASEGATAPDELLRLYEEAAQALEAGASKLQGLAFAWQSLAHAWTRHGDVLGRSDRDPRASYRRAAQAYRQGLALGTEVHRSRLFSGLCVAQSEAAYYGISHRDSVPADEVDATLSEAKHACQEALQSDPGYLSALSNLGTAYWTEVEWRIATGRSPLDAARQGQETFRRLLELAPDHVSGRINLTGLVAAKVNWQLDEDDTASSSLTEALREVREAIESLVPLADEFAGDVKWSLAPLETLRASLLCRSGDPGAPRAWEKAAKAHEALARTAPPSGRLAFEVARFHRRAAECAQRRDDLPRVRRELRLGIAAAEESLRRAPTLTAAREELRRLSSLEQLTG